MAYLTHPTKPSQGLSRIEVVIMIPITLVMLALLLPLILEMDQKTKAMLAVDRSNLRQIGVSMYAYAADHDGAFPSHPRDILSYMPSSPERIFFNPFQEERDVMDRGDGNGVTVRYGSYVFVNLGSGLDEIEKPAEFILAYSAKSSRKQAERNVMFADGHVERMEEKALQDALPEGVDVDALDGP